MRSAKLLARSKAQTTLVACVMCYLGSGENVLRTKFLISLSLIVLVTLIRVLMCHGKSLIVVHLNLLGIGSHHR